MPWKPGLYHLPAEGLRGASGNEDESLNLKNSCHIGEGGGRGVVGAGSRCAANQSSRMGPAAWDVGPICDRQQRRVLTVTLVAAPDAVL